MWQLDWQHLCIYNKWLNTVKMTQCMYKKKLLKNKLKKKMAIKIANWIYIAGSKPGKVFARLAEKRYQRRIKKLINDTKKN